MKVKAKEKSTDLVKSQRKVQWKWVNYFQFALHYDGNFEKTSVSKVKEYVAWKVSVSLSVQSNVAISFGAGSAFTTREFWKTTGRRFIRNLLQWRWTFLQLQYHRPMSKDYFQSVDCCLQDAEIVWPDHWLWEFVWRWIWAFYVHLVFCDWVRIWVSEWVCRL